MKLFQKKTEHVTDWSDGAIEAKLKAAKTECEENEDDEDFFPAPLLKTVLTQGGIGALVIIVCAGFTIATKQAVYLVGFLFAAYLLYNAITIIYDFKRDLIHQRILVCSSVTKTLSGTNIIMQDPNETPVKIYTFAFPKKYCPFYESGVYIVFTHDNEPRRIVGWQQM